MEETFAPRDILSAAELRALSERRDGPGLVRLGVQLALLLGTAPLAFSEHALAWPALGLHGVVQGTMFATAHEALHGTAFRARALNRAALWLSCALVLMSPTAFRAFHFGHHRYTHTPGKDPELPLAVMNDWPRSRVALWILWSGLPYLAGRLFGLAFFALGAPEPLYSRSFAYVRAEERPRIAAEALGIIALHAGVLAIGAWLWAPLLRWPAVWVFAHLIQGVWLSAEHTGLPGEGSIFERTRTVRLDPVRAFFSWNMTFHAEHHGWPSVPFWQLPALHERVRGALVHVHPGFGPVMKEGARS